MKKINRLRKNHDFQRVINSKKSIVSKNLVIYFIPNKESGARVGISISKKFTNAVGRNKIRRQVRALLDEINIYAMTYDIVLIIRRPFMSASYSEKLISLKKQLERM